jgi:hypothetical protein
MKSKNIFLGITFIVLTLLVFNSCTDSEPTPKVYYSAIPADPTPLVGTSFLMGLDKDSIKITLKWEGKATVQPKWDIYCGTDPDNMVKVASKVASNTYDLYLKSGSVYYWYVETVDDNNIKSTSDTWNLSLVTPFVGIYNCDEPAESYSYDVDFTKVNSTSIITTNYWNSGWNATFTLDFINNTYSMPLTTWGTYNGIESGTINPQTGKMVGTYTINHLKSGVWSVTETGVHTYTLK